LTGWEKKTEAERIVLTFQTFEIINEGRATREAKKAAAVYNRKRSPH
jgi:hypothetical protein